MRDPFQTRASPVLLLLDNGSTRADSTRRLRRLASALEERVGSPVHPVSLQHSDKVPASALGGRPADTLIPFLRRSLSQGRRDFLVLPLFFGPSRGIVELVPRAAESLEPELGRFAIRIAPELCPLPRGEPRLARILAEQVRQTAETAGIAPRRAVLVDHGSPIPEVTAVRRWLAGRLAVELGPDCRLEEAVMERRPGAEYDFNGETLARVLERLAQEDPYTPVLLALLFLAPGRHAGPGGDIAGICAGAQAAHPGLGIYRSPPVGAHPALIDILADRLAQALGSGGGERPTTEDSFDWTAR